MRLILEINGGKLARHKAVLGAGDRVTFGRSERAGMAVPHDRRLSARHFEVFWDGTTAMVRDLNSRTGTLVDGQVITEAPVYHCGWIRAGHTDWLVSHELATPGWDMLAEPAMAAVALKQLRPKLGSLFAVLDSARDDRIGVLLRQSVDPYRSLFDGLDGDTVAEAAPYVVKLREDSQLLARLVEEGWGRRWGIFMTSKSTLSKLRRQLRRLLLIVGEGNENERYFRYYDPEIFDTFAAVITPRQRAEFLTEVASFLWENPAGIMCRLAA